MAEALDVGEPRAATEAAPEPPRERIRWYRRRFAVALVLGAVVYLVYIASPVTQTTDSRWMLYVSLNIERHGRTDLDNYGDVIARLNRIEITHAYGHDYNLSPPGASVLAVPFAFAADKVLGVFGVDIDTFFHDHPPSRFEVVVASLFVALAAVVIYAIGGEAGLDIPRSVLLALIFAFATAAWSTASRAMWQHGPVMLLYATALYMFLVARRRPRYAGLAGAVLAYAFVVRPAAFIPAAVFGIYVLLRHRRQLPLFCATAAVVAVPWLALNMSTYHALVPPYYVETPRGVPHFLQAAAGNLVSPSRGLLVYSPVLVFAVVGVVMLVRAKRFDLLDGAVAAVVVLHFVLISLWPEWWAGHAFGPRYFSDVVPFIVWFLVPVLAPRPAGRYRTAGVALFAVALAASVLINMNGAFRTATFRWNVTPDNIDRDHGRLWDWSDPQFLR